jgi:hypothetical protein
VVTILEHVPQPLLFLSKLALGYLDFKHHAVSLEMPRADIKVKKSFRFAPSDLQRRINGGFVAVTTKGKSRHYFLGLNSLRIMISTASVAKIIGRYIIG